MKMTPSALKVLNPVIGRTLLALLCGLSLPVAAQDQSEKRRSYEADRRACLSGATGQALEACIKEARAVLAQQPGATPSLSSEQLQRNNLKRCDSLDGSERTDCVSRMQGEGTVSGSVAGGGILRELVTTEVVTSPPKQPTAAGAVK